MFGLTGSLQNRVVQISVQKGGKTSHSSAIQMIEGTQILKKVGGNSFNLMLSEDGIVSVVDAKGRILTLESNQVKSIVDGDLKVSFTHREDFVSHDNNFFLKFCIYSLMVHVVLAIAFTLVPNTPPKIQVKKQETIDKDRIANLLKKLDKKPEPKKPEPKKVVKKPKPKPEKKVVKKVVKKPEPKKVVQKPQPKKKVVKKVVKIQPKTKPVQKKRVVKKISKKPVMAKAPTPKPAVKLARKVKPAGPTPAQIAAQKKAAEAAARAQAQAAAKAKALKSLNFLSGAQGSFQLKNANYDDSKKGKAYAATTNTAVKASAGFGNLVVENGNGIATKGARAVASGKTINESGYEKALNGVQGRVSVSEVSGGKFSESLLSNKMSLSGQGTIPQSEIEKILSKHIAQLRYCYEKALLSNSNLRGNLTMKWTIGTSGSVGGVKVVKSDLNNGGLHDCVSQKLVSIRFPKPSGGGEVLVNYPFSFNSSSL